jgi:DNA processing protein
MSERACDRCLARSWLLGRLAAHLETARPRIDRVLGLSDEDLIAAIGAGRRDEIARELERLDVAAERDRARAVGLESICRCDAEYPERLRALHNPPAALHVAGGLGRFLALAAEDPVAIVGARRGSQYGLEVARSLGRGLGRAAVTVLSGMALGIDCAAHAGALSADAPTVAVLPGPADRPYPRGRRALYRQIIARGAAVSELPPGASVWRWAFPARNRIIAGLAASTVVVEAGARSGSLLTAGYARSLRRPVGAVPGRVTSPYSAGSHWLLAHGAYLVTGPQDVLDQVFGAGIRAAATEERAELVPELRALLSAIADGDGTSAALARAGLAPDQALAALATLELAGYVRRGPGGRFSVIP